ncbi:FkbM family methyltransferase [Vibrio rhodolitus]|uniref:FkbM family methyltransferase n=1 Tax=Vibrio rhodolitus TaxID=2231649 RepID=UPI000E0CB216|nr:FkbM family methyltransferase [Vibrio rhodolitus]
MKLFSVKNYYSFDYVKDVYISKYLNKKAKLYRDEREHHMAVFANDHIGEQIFLHGVYERKEIEIIEELFHQLGVDTSKYTAIDIGANIGNHTIMFSKFFKEVISFEPNPNTFKLLSFNTHLINNVNINNVGIGNKEEDLTLYENPTNMGGASTKTSREKSRGIDITIKKLDSYLPDTLENVGLIKIDVEGMEYQVLQGSLSIIEKNKPVIIFEQSVSDFIDGGNDTLSTLLLKNIGYTIYWISSEDDEVSNKWVRRINKLQKIVFNKESRIDIVTGDVIPARFHHMLVAISK